MRIKILLKQHQTYRTAISFFLYGLIVFTSLGRSLHILTEHHHSEPHPVCMLDADVDKNKSHLHDAHYLTDICDWCQYVVQSFCLYSWNGIESTSVVGTLDQFVLSFITEPFFTRSITANGQRGPPAV